MKISTRGRYALRMMVDLAIHQGDGCVSLTDISKRQGISKKYLEQIIPLLSRQGFLTTTRGYRGGYRLSRLPTEYKVGDVLRATEGSLAPVYCAENSSQCKSCESCSTFPVWKKLAKVVSQYLDGLTLQDLVDGKVDFDQDSLDSLVFFEDGAGI